MRHAPLLLIVLVLAGCGRAEAPAPGDAPATAALRSMPAMEAASVDMAAAKASPPAGSQPDLPPTTSPAAMIAYSYSMGLELPAKQVVALRDAHLEACTMAGPAKCQLLGASSSTSGEDQVSAELHLRGAPEWLDGFRAGIEADAGRLKGRLLSSTISSEDLTRQIVDTEATLRAQTKLRERLIELLSHHQGKLADLLEVERELARVQGEIDARTSELNVMRMRIAMSDLVVSYASEGVPVSDRTVDPTLQAFNEFLGIVSYSLAEVIRFVAGVLPWFLVVLPALWLLRRWWHRRRRSPG